MRHARRLTLPLLATLLIGCGGAGTGDGGDGSDPGRAPEIVSITPNAFLSVTPKQLLVNGYGFGSSGEEAILRFTANEGTPFRGRTSATVDLPATVANPNHARATTPFEFCDEEIWAQVRLIRSDGTPSTNSHAVHLKPAVRKVDPSPAGYSYFGSSVAVEGGAAVAGGFGGYGFAKLYGIIEEPSSMTEVHEHGEVSSVESGSQLGVAVEVTPEWIFVGDPEVDVLDQLPDGSWVESLAAGVVRAYALDWVGGQYPPPRIGQRHDDVKASDRHSDCHFGAALAYSRGFLIVGAPRKDYDLAVQAGAAYIYGVPSPGGSFYEYARLLPFQPGDVSRWGGGREDRFGSSVAIDGEAGVAVVGAPFADGAAVESGAVWVYVRRGTAWQPEERIIAPDGESYDRFGAHVAVEGDTVVVGAPGNERRGLGAGATYVFRRSAGHWSEHQRLEPTGSATRQALGGAVAILRDLILVGAPGDTNRLTEGAGAVFVFDLQGDGYWHEIAKLVAPVPFAFQAFGAAVDLDNEHIIVGAPYDDTQGVLYAGAIYVY